MTPAALTLPRQSPTTLRSLLFSAPAQKVWLVALIAFMLLVTALALRPASAFHPTLGWDKLNHAVAFMTMAFCGHFAFRDRPRATFWTIFLLMALGVGIEFMQATIPGREADLEDVVADAVGLAMGLVMALALAHKLERRKRPRQGPRQGPRQQRT